MRDEVQCFFDVIAFCDCPFDFLFEAKTFCGRSSACRSKVLDDSGLTVFDPDNLLQALAAAALAEVAVIVHCENSKLLFHPHLPVCLTHRVSAVAVLMVE